MGPASKSGGNISTTVQCKPMKLSGMWNDCMCKTWHELSIYICKIKRFNLWQVQANKMKDFSKIAMLLHFGDCF